MGSISDPPDGPRPLGPSPFAKSDAPIGKWLIRFFAFFVAAWVLVYLIAPAFSGYHIGFNSSTDNTCVSHVLQWCKYVAGNGSPPG